MQLGAQHGRKLLYERLSLGFHRCNHIVTMKQVHCVLIFAVLLTWSTLVQAAIAIPRSYIVEYSTNDQHDTIDSELTPYKDLYQIHHVYSSRLFHGMSFTLKDDPAIAATSVAAGAGINPVSYAQIDKLHPVYTHLEQHPVIKNIYPIYEVPRPQWQPNQRNATFPYSNNDVQIYDIHQQLGIQGQNVLIGVLDSGIDYNHPALGKGFGPGYKVKAGKNLVEPSNDEKFGIESLGEDDPFDPCTTADSANLAVFRVFGCEGGAGEDTIIKAMEMAYEAGCQVINLSLGIENGWPEDAMAVVAERLTKQGVVVVGVAGNQGSDGIYSQNSPASGKHVISAASIDNSLSLSNVVQFSIIADEYFPYVPSSTTTSFPNGTIAPILSEDSSVPFGCNNDTSITPDNAKGQVLFLKRGSCTFREKLQKAKQMGAIAVLFYDPDVSSKTVVVAKTEQDTLPCAGIDLKVATRLIQYMQESDTSKPMLIEFPVEQKVIFPETAGRISEFSSTGPNYELDLKPSVTGIGGDVYSTLPSHITGGWGVRSGTSMASPHVAGAAALLVNYYTEQKIETTPAYIMEQLQNHGRLILSDNGRIENPVVQGAGLIQPYDSIMSKLHVSPAQISFNDTASATNYKTHTLTIVNSGDTPIDIALGNIPSQSIQSYANTSSFIPTEPVIKNGSVTVDLDFSSTSLKIPANSQVKVTVRVVLPDPNSLTYHYQMYGGFIALTQIDTQRRLATVPYFGVLGRMIDVPVFDRGFPYLAVSKESDAKLDLTHSYVYDMNRKVSTKPAIVIRLLSGTAQINIDVYRSNGTLMGVMDSGPWVYNQRNKLSQENYDTSIAWNGKIVASDKTTQVPDGDYYIQLRALKHFGDVDNAMDWQEWKSGLIQVKS
ncbi:subtilisin-like protease [Mucor ambiguus]|uniref:Subtilisin-like protease n=1 Tax=Mucor ambiguus TaxID=91626 RepID=A0A0C9MTD2_9FUNG|nr:subtilisin-like protease [Mucor ambiguus]